MPPDGDGPPYSLVEHGMGFALAGDAEAVAVAVLDLTSRARNGPVPGSVSAAARTASRQWGGRESAMELLAGAGVVVTGAGAGIGAAVARQFAAEGARVVVNDINADTAAEVAASCGGTAVTADMATEEGVATLIAAATEALGEIDMFCANAGIARLGGPEAAEDDWDASFQINVMAHVRAARLLLPGWLARGRGHLICTVSAAGVLTMLGSAPYSVSKHAALSFAEWLAATYAHRGITVQAICPLGVRTAMLADPGPVAETLLLETAIEPEVVAGAVMEALADGRFLILPHAEVAKMYAGRAADPDRWLRGMNKLQRKIEEGPAWLSRAVG
jgi:NAD(P)-dependent dehydrogenase (short-subunit alcohol dehydrogenase family)